MTSVLLITESERVQRAFESIERDGLLQLRSAATVVEADLEISDFAPDLVFLQSRISGFSSDITLRHLKKTLPVDAKVVVLAIDADDAAQARKQGDAFVDLTVTDEALSDGILNVLQAERAAAPKGAKGRGAAAVKKGAAKAVAGGAVPASAIEVTAQPGMPEQEGPAAATAKIGKGGAARTGRKRAAKEPASAEATMEEQAATLPVQEPVAEGTPAGLPVQEPVVEEPRPAEQLQETVSKPEKRAKVPAVPAGKKAAVKKPASAPVPVVPVPVIQESAQQQELYPEEPPPGLAMEEPGTEEPTPAFAREEPEHAAAEEAAAAFSAEGAGESQALSFAEMMHLAASKHGPAYPDNVEERVRIGQAVPATGEPRDMPPTAGREGAAAAKDFYARETLEEALSRSEKKSNRRWILPIGLALLLIPLAYYISANMAEAPQLPLQVGPSRPDQGPGKLPVPPAQAAAPTSASRTRRTNAPSEAQVVTPKAAPTKAAVPITKPAPAAAPQAAPAVKQPVTQAAKPAPELQGKAAARGGVKAIPPFLAGTRLDANYGKTHRGWVRYIGAKAEYKLFREGDTFRALQVIALGGETISDQIYERALLEFGGIDSYQLQSTDKKDNFLIEHGVAKGGLGVTIYRKKNDLSMKGLVLFFR